MHAKSSRQTGNLLLGHGLIAAPAAVFCTGLRQGAELSFAFCILTAVTVLFSLVIPQRISRSVRIVLYSVIAGLVYIPTVLLTVFVFREAGFGMYLPLLCSGLYLTALHDRFFPRKGLCKALLRQILPSVGLMLMMGLLREVFGAGTLCGLTLFAQPPLPALLAPPFGLMLLVCMAVLHSAMREGERHAVHD